MSDDQRKYYNAIKKMFAMKPQKALPIPKVSKLQSNMGTISIYLLFL